MGLTRKQELMERDQYLTKQINRLTEELKQVHVELNKELQLEKQRRKVINDPSYQADTDALK